LPQGPPFTRYSYYSDPMSWPLFILHLLIILLWHRDITL